MKGAQQVEPLAPLPMTGLGIDVAHKAAKTMVEAFGERMVPPDGLQKGVEQGRLGRKSKKGFYLYVDDGKKKGGKQVDDTVYDLTPHGRKRKSMNLARGRLNERTLDIAEAVGAIAKEMGRSPSQVALAWTLLNPAVTSPLIGARTYEQFEDNLAALDITFSDEQIARLDEVSRIETCFPHDMLRGELSKGLFGGVDIEKPPYR